MTDAVLEEILDEIAEVDPKCVKCDAPMVKNHHWRHAGEAERQELLDEGYRPPAARGHCQPCYRRLTPEERAAAPSGKPGTGKRSSIPDSAVRDLVRAMANGETIVAFARRRGLKHSTLDGAYRRAKRNGEVS